MAMIHMLIIFASMLLRTRSCREEGMGSIVESQFVRHKQNLVAQMVLGGSLRPHLQLVQAQNLRPGIHVLNMLRLTQRVFAIAQVAIIRWVRVEMGGTGQSIV